MILDENRALDEEANRRNVRRNTLMATKYKVIMHYSDGTDEELEELYDTETEAREAGLYAISCYHLGGEILHESNPGDYPYDEDEEVEFDIEEVRE